MPTEQARVHIVPLTLPKANAVVTQLHRHHAAIPGGFGWFCVGAVADGLLIGAAIAGRPTNRNNDDGQTVEVLRVATDGTPNAPSALLGACARAAKAVGAARIITYTLDSESGISLRGAGWRREADGIDSWWTHPGKDGNGRVPAVNREHMAQRKVRWGLTFREPVPYATPSTEDETAQPDLLELLADSVDKEGLDRVPGNQDATQADALTTEARDLAICAVDGDRPAKDRGQHVGRVGLAPSELHDLTLATPHGGCMAPGCAQCGRTA